MPIKIPDNLPAYEILNNENVFVMKDTRAIHQDIRPLQIVILNLMPRKVETETQLLRVLANTPLQVDVILLYTKSYIPKNTSLEHLNTFYKTFDEIKDQKFDGLIITGAPVEQMEFEDVAYWPELEKILKWSKDHVFSTFHICWGAQAGLYYHYGVPKYVLDKKVFGVFPHVIEKPVKLVRGFDDEFFAPQSRYTEILRDDIEKVKELEVISYSKESGVYIISSKNGRQIFVTGHSEYDPTTLKWEYDRDVGQGINIEIPKNYYPGNNPSMNPVVRWRSHGNLLFSNWLNYYVYQETPYNLEEIE